MPTVLDLTHDCLGVVTSFFDVRDIWTFMLLNRQMRDCGYYKNMTKLQCSGVSIPLSHSFRHWVPIIKRYTGEGTTITFVGVDNNKSHDQLQYRVFRGCDILMPPNVTTLGFRGCQIIWPLPLPLDNSAVDTLVFDGMSEYDDVKNKPFFTGEIVVDGNKNHHPSIRKIVLKNAFLDDRMLNLLASIFPQLDELVLDGVRFWMHITSAELISAFEKLTSLKKFSWINCTHETIEYTKSRTLSTSVTAILDVLPKTLSHLTLLCDPTAIKLVNNQQMEHHLPKGLMYLNTCRPFVWPQSLQMDPNVDIPDLVLLRFHTKSEDKVTDDKDTLMVLRHAGFPNLSSVTHNGAKLQMI